MWPVSDSFLRALRGSHRIAVRARAYYDGVEVASSGTDFELVGGSVRAEGRSGVRRSLEGVTIVAPSGDVADLDWLTEDGVELEVERGIVFPTGRRELVPVGRFRVDALRDSAQLRGGVEIVSAPDLFARIVDARFPKPRKVTRGATLIEQIELIVWDVIPGAVVINETGDTTTEVRPSAVWDRDRAEALTDLARALGADVFFDPVGQLVVRPVPTGHFGVDWTLDASSSGGVILSADRTRTRAGVYNYVRAFSSPGDGEAVVSGVSQDNDPTSRTYVGGPFGLVPRFFSSQHLRTAAQAKVAAQAILAKSLGRRMSLSLESIVNPALEVGDRIAVGLPDGSTARHIVDGFDLPLTADGSMTISTREREEVRGE